MTEGTRFLGQTDSLRVYARGDFAVGINPLLNTITTFGSVFDVTQGAALEGGEVNAAELAFAEQAITLATQRASQKTGRRYTIPKALRASAAEAKDTLDGIDKVRAHVLATRDQVTLREAQFIGESDFLEEDKERWIRAINKAEGISEIAAVPDEYSEDTEVYDYLIRIREDRIDRMYRIWADGSFDVWNGGGWTGGMWDTIWEVDAEFDEAAGFMPDETIIHLPIDEQAAQMLELPLMDAFFHGIDIDAIQDPEEYVLYADAIDELTSDPILAAASNAEAYDAQERAQNAKKQVRDKNGKFAKQGSRVVIGGNVTDGAGSITRLLPEVGKVRVRLDSGEEIDVDGNLIESEDVYKTLNPVPQAVNTPAYNVQGIFGQKREVLKPFIANLPETLTPMEPSELRGLLEEYPGWVAAQRAANPGARTGDTSEHPLLAKWYGMEKRKEDTQAAIRASGADENPLRARAAEAASKAPAPAAAPVEGETPEASADEPPTDVQPIYMAFVDPDNLRAVTKLIAIVPADGESTSPAVYQRKGGAWVADSEAMTDLNSTTPPPVVPLDSTVLNDVLLQVDASNGDEGEKAEPLAASAMLGGEESARALITEPLTAAGGADRNRGGAEKLRKYWTVGPGGAKIAWGTPGDWRRCRRYLSKYLGPRAAGYCQLRHKEMTGTWTGDKEHLDRFETMTEALVAAAWEHAPQTALTDRERLDEVEGGAHFIIPLIIPEGVESGDRRILEEGSLSHRDLPIELLWQPKTADGHDGSYIVGRIDSIERVAHGLGNARGIFDTSEHAREAERMVRQGFLRGVSADLDAFESSAVFETDDEGEGIEGTEKTVINKARIMAVTLVAKRAFQECTIQLEDVVDMTEESALVACGYIAGEIPVTPPRNWFENPLLSGPTPLTVSEDGRVFGHIALWKTEHIGSRAVKPPRSRSNYSYFHTGHLRTDDGSDISVGQLTLSGGHAGLQASAQDAVKHYDDTHSAAADVRAGEDRFGIWVSGALRPDMDALKVRQFRAAAPSGDWRPIEGNLELVAVCQVNVPGFPVARALVASGGEMTALVAAGVAPLVEMRNRLDQMDPRAAAAIRKFNEVRQERYEALVASAHAAVSRFEALSENRYVSRAARDALAAEGASLSSGAFSIGTVEDLDHAVTIFQHAPDKVAAKAHMRKAAKALGATDRLPAEWFSIRERLATFASAKKDIPAAEGRGEGESQITRTTKFTPETQPRDWRGRYRRVLARLKEDLGPRMSAEIEKKIDETSRFDLLGDYMESSAHALDLMKALDTVRGDDLNSATLREASRDLGLTISNLPLPFDNQAQKIRFSDLPQVLKDVIEYSIDLADNMEGTDEVKAAADELRSFISGGDLYSQADISERLARMMNLIFSDQADETTAEPVAEAEPEAEVEVTPETEEPQQTPTVEPEKDDEDAK